MSVIIQLHQNLQSYFHFTDYTPGQFVAFSTTFGINTLSDIKTVDTKMQLKMVEAVKAKKDKVETVEILNKMVTTVTAKKDTTETVEILNDAMENIEKSSDETTATTTADEGIKNNPNVYIPNQFQVPIYILSKYYVSLRKYLLLQALNLLLEAI